MKNTIILIGAALVLQKEGQATEVISPGQIIEETSAGNVAKCNANATQASLTIAVEDANDGKLITDDYAIGSRVFGRTLLPGCVAQGKVAAAAVAIAYGDNLTLDGDGNFKKATGTDIVKAIAKEAVDNSGGGSSVFIKIEAI